MVAQLRRSVRKYHSLSPQCSQKELLEFHMEQSEEERAFGPIRQYPGTPLHPFIQSLRQPYTPKCCSTSVLECVSRSINSHHSFSAFRHVLLDVPVLFPQL
eukprot:4671004-Amphidinium_carterae.2